MKEHKVMRKALQILVSALVAGAWVSIALAAPPEGRKVQADAPTVHLFRFNEGKGDQTRDEVTGETISLQGHQWAEGVDGQALVWTRADGMGKSDIPSPPLDKGFTLEFWFRMDECLDSTKNTSPYEFDSALLFSGHWYAFKFRQRYLIATLCFEGNFSELLSNQPVSVGEWTHAAVTYDPAHPKLTWQEPEPDLKWKTRYPRCGFSAGEYRDGYLYIPRLDHLDVYKVPTMK